MTGGDSPTKVREGCAGRGQRGTGLVCWETAGRLTWPALNRRKRSTGADAGRRGSQGGTRARLWGPEGPGILS